MGFEGLQNRVGGCSQGALPSVQLHGRSLGFCSEGHLLKGALWL